MHLSIFLLVLEWTAWQCMQAAWWPCLILSCDHVGGLGDQSVLLYTTHFRPCVLYTVHSVLYTVYSVQGTVHSVQCTVHSVQCTVHSVQCTCIQCTVYTNSDHVGGLVDQSILLHTPHFRPCVLYTVLFTVYSVLYTVCSVRYTVCSVRYTAYSVLYTVYNVHVHNVQCTQIVTKWGAAGSISSSVHSAFQTLCVLYTVYSVVYTM